MKRDRAKELTEVDTQEILNKAFDLPAEYSQEELRVISFVDKYVEENDIEFPRPRKHIVLKTERGWTVTMLDLGGLMRGDRTKDLTFHVESARQGFRVVEGRVR